MRHNTYAPPAGRGRASIGSVRLFGGWLLGSTQAHEDADIGVGHRNQRRPLVVGQGVDLLRGYVSEGPGFHAGTVARWIVPAFAATAL